MPEQYRVNEMHCPSCSALLDGVMTVSGQGKPNPFDVTVCIYCAAMLEFIFGEGDNLNLRQLTPSKLRKIGEEDMPALTSLLRAHWVALLEVKRRRKAQGICN